MAYGNALLTASSLQNQINSHEKAYTTTIDVRWPDGLLAN
jgi:hypothetical protein